MSGNAKLVKIIGFMFGMTVKECVLELDVPQVKVWDIAYEDPSNFEDTLPFIRCPYRTAPSIVDLNG